MTLGKNPDNDFVISGDSTVSRLHLLVERFGDRWRIQDVGTPNGGTLVNGHRVQVDVESSWFLTDGDEIVVGRTRLCFHDGQRPSFDVVGHVTPPPSIG
jgi:pSer/pThr/pTyr-binding forkhead associated (FHA) protein